MAVPHSHPTAPARAVSPSLLRLSVGERLGIACGFAVLLWGAVLWVLAGINP